MEIFCTPHPRPTKKRPVKIREIRGADKAPASRQTSHFCQAVKRLASKGATPPVRLQRGGESRRDSVMGPRPDFAPPTTLPARLVISTSPPRTPAPTQAEFTEGAPAFTEGTGHSTPPWSPPRSCPTALTRPKGVRRFRHLSQRPGAAGHPPPVAHHRGSRN